MNAKYGWEIKNHKTEGIYLFIGEAINATNAQDGQRMAAYVQDGTLYVREMDEFKEKFEAPCVRLNEELGLLRRVYEKARRVLRFRGVESYKFNEALDETDEAIEAIKLLDGGQRDVDV